MRASKARTGRTNEEHGNKKPTISELFLPKSLSKSIYDIRYKPLSSFFPSTLSCISTGEDHHFFENLMLKSNSFFLNNLSQIMFL